MVINIKIKNLALIFGLCIISFLFTSCTSKQTQTPFTFIRDNGGDYYAVKLDKTWGYADKYGKVIIKPKFVDVTPFIDDIAFVKVDTKWGLIDINDNWIVQPKFESIYERNKLSPNDEYTDRFSSGLEPVKFQGKWGFIDKTGSFVIAPQYNDANKFRHGIALVQKDKERFFIDNHDEVVISEKKIKNAIFTGPGTGMYSKGFFKVFNKRTPDKWAIMTREGKIISDWQPDSGILFYSLPDSDITPFMKKKKIGFIEYKSDGSYKVIIEPKFDETQPEFSENLVAVKIKDKWGFADKAGNFAIEPKFVYAENFKNGLAVVGIEPAIWGIVDKTGKVLFQKEAFYLTNFSEGYAFFYTYKDDEIKAGIIDMQGKTITEPQFYDFGGEVFSLDFKFKNGACIVANKGLKKGVIDTKGEWLIQPEFDTILSNNNKLFITIKNNKYGVIDAYGIWIIDPEYAFITSDDYNTFIVAKNGKWGLVDKYGKFLLKI